MKRMMVLLVVAATIFGFAAQSHANLTVVGSGTIIGGDGNAYQLIYDSALNVTWYDYSNLGPYRNGNYQGLQWQNALSWASNLAVNINDNNITGWRLPSIDEMSYLYHAELVNVGYSNPFHYLFSTYYFSGTPYSGSPDYAWALNFYDGSQLPLPKGNSDFVIALIPGNVAATPIPAAVYLFGSGLLGIVGIRKKMMNK